MYWRTTTTGKASKTKQSPLDKHNFCSEGLSVLYANDKVTKMSGNGYLCGEMKNLNKLGTEGSSWEFEDFDLFTMQSTTGATTSSKDKDREMGVSRGLSRRGEGEEEEEEESWP